MRSIYSAPRSVDHLARPGEPLRKIEVEILRQLAAGAYDGEIAHALEISVRTYRRYLTAALRKLSARTRAHAVAIALARRLITLPHAHTPPPPSKETAS